MDKNLKDKLVEMVEDDLNKVFCELQTLKGVTSGDVTPMDFLQLEKKVEDIVDFINILVDEQVEDNFIEEVL